MLIIPAIDLEGGCVVRYVQGKREKKIYSRNPLQTAKHWVKCGAEFLHIVDLDGAFSGIPKNIRIAKAIAREITVPVEFGGGVRSLALIEELLKSGVSRVVLGTRAVLEKSFLKKAFAKFKKKIIVSVDAKEEKILVKGWQKSAGAHILDFAQDLEKIGFKELIYTDTLKDGTLCGPNIKGIKNLLKETGLRIIASGGISSLEDILKLKQLETKRVSGVIIGKALYEGRFTLQQAIKISQRRESKVVTC